MNVVVYDKGNGMKCCVSPVPRRLRVRDCGDNSRKRFALMMRPRIVKRVGHGMALAVSLTNDESVRIVEIARNR